MIRFRVPTDAVYFNTRNKIQSIQKLKKNLRKKVKILKMIHYLQKHLKNKKINLWIFSNNKNKVWKIKESPFKLKNQIWYYWKIMMLPCIISLLIKTINIRDQVRKIFSNKNTLIWKRKILLNKIFWWITNRMTQMKNLMMKKSSVSTRLIKLKKHSKLKIYQIVICQKAPLIVKMKNAQVHNLLRIPA